MFRYLYIGLLTIITTNLFPNSGHANPHLKGSKLEYVDSWKKLPSIEAQSIQTGKIIKFAPEKGTAKVIIFLASWCLKCQKLIPEIKKIEMEYKDKHTDFLYVFTHDTESDAMGFIKGYKIDTQAILANKKILNDFHQPPLPSIYIGDRYEWLGHREISLNEEGLKKISRYLKAHTRI